jgi:hypothetical protein
MRAFSFGAGFLIVSLTIGPASAAPVRPRPALQPYSTVHQAQSGDCPALPGGTGLLSDGDFSQAVDPGDINLTPTQGTVFAPNWIVTQGNVDFNGSTYWDMGGYCSVDLDGLNVVGGIAPNPFRSIDRKMYTVTFLMSGNGGAPPTVKTMTLRANRHVRRFTWDTTNNHDVEHGDTQWESWTFRSGGGQVALSFLSTDPPGSGRGIVVAAISVTEAP